MATKKSTQTAKTKTAKTKTKPVKTTIKKSVPKTVHATEPYHKGFGIILILVGIILALALILGATLCLRDLEKRDAKLFAADYTSVSEDNLFKIKSGKEIIDILEHGTGVVFLGFPECPWCQAYAPMLNDLAKEYGLSEIYYHNTFDDWQNDTKEYKKITALLSDFLQFDNVGNKHLYVPNTAFVVNGEIVGNDWETSKDTLDASTPEEYWTEERVEAWKEKVGALF
ncbi:hypothetical protein IJ380_02765, partial [Candidatus Saccharibacteria bacterium]|nr:hypothetical protein [Candidatus Saccharibacteria bacterium]